ncbi:GNAT family N-acetyltransferase [Rhizobium sp. 11515TR]|jgi:putative acetyltransferase|uniref:GNAT family N-acetyltransferase n=1 Tax=unclassified Rhizobium TaxID=2613769 RepID=UPI000BA851D2|nr:N-acetyltransferase [Rhizobium sp. 11515TR]ASW07110.1 GNAT family N-acetyltransferase [Rhizobium sp. 11515TR]
MAISLTHIRAEEAKDIDAIHAITSAAFEGKNYSSGTEAAIIDALRMAGALTLSLVAVESDEIVGHVAFSPVTIESRAKKWFGLGPVSVRPDQQGKGIGKALIENGLAQLRERGANGCVVLGDPRYYTRFGFTSDGTLHYADVPAEYFQRIVFKGPAPKGAVVFHAGFDAA